MKEDSDIFGVALRFNLAAKKGYLEPVIDRYGQITPKSGNGFNHKHLTALRQVLDLSLRQWNNAEVLKFANGVLKIHVLKTGFPRQFFEQHSL